MPLLQRREAEAVPWLLHYEAAAAELAGLEDRAAWARPAPTTDKLYMSLGGGDMIEVASGCGVALDEFAYKNGVLCYEGEDKLCHILLFPRVIQNLHT